ncbi:MAG: ABC transporter permease [Oscillospiraceae bacterium]
MESAKKFKKRSQIAEVWNRLKKNKMAIIGMVIMILIVIMAMGADFIVNYEKDVIKQDIPHMLEGPSAQHIFGTDELGRDIFARVIYGSRVSLEVGVLSVIISLSIGGTLGAISGYYGGTVDNIIMRIMDIFLAIPSIMLAITIVAALGANMFNLMLSIGIAAVPSYARIVRAAVMSVKDQEFIEASRAIGAKNATIILKEVIPNCLAPIIVQVTLNVADAIISTAALSFIGLGVQPPQPEWGSMLSGGRPYLRDAWHITFFPGLAIVVTILSLNLLGDGLRDALDPKLKQ